MIAHVARGILVGLAMGLFALAPLHGQEETVSISGLVVDATTGRAIPSAMIRLGQSELWAVSDGDGGFVLEGLTPGWQVIQVDATGYAATGWPAEAGAVEEITIELEPEPFELEGFDISVIPYKTRLKRRRSLRYKGHAYVIDADLLSGSTKDNVWDLVGDRHGFHFEGFSDHGCPIATVYGVRTIVTLIVNERPVPIHRFQTFEPGLFAMVEVWDVVGDLPPIIRAYTQDYLDQMDRTGALATPVEMTFRMCPETPPPGVPIRPTGRR